VISNQPNDHYRDDCPQSAQKISFDFRCLRTSIILAHHVFHVRHPRFTRNPLGPVARVEMSREREAKKQMTSSKRHAEMLRHAMSVSQGNARSLSYLPLHAPC